MVPPGGTLAEFAYRKCYGVHMIFRRTLLAGLLVFALASCGGDDSSNVSDMIEEATSDTGGDASTSGDGADMGEYEATGNECIDAAAAFGTAVASLSLAMSAEGFDLETYNKNMDTARAAIADSAKADFDIVADAYDEMAEILVKVSDAGGIETEEGMNILNSSESTFNDPAIQEAADRLGTYYASECFEYYGGIDQ